ncbi:MFS transporter [Tundrisphaera lichenicola]|uniref:MFS transporter n=1 Tax=Tundrisphaera lichenicola TaxID=2029860 RepID=UPI003EBE9D82
MTHLQAGDRASESIVEHPSGGHPTHVRRVVLASACALAVVTYIHRAGFGSNSSELLRDLGMDVRDLGWMTVAFMLGYGLFEIPWGRLGDRFGSRGLLALVVLGGSLLTAGVAFAVLLPRAYAVQLGFLLTLRFLFGMFQAGTFPLLSRLMADWMPTTERGSAQGFIWMFSRAGGVLAPLLMVWLFHQMGNWRLPLVLGAGLGLVWCLAVWPWLRNRPEQMSRVNEAELALIAAGRAARKPDSHHDVPWRVMLGSRNVWALWGMYGCLGYSGNFFMYLFASYLQDSRHFDKDTAKWLLVVPFATGIFACISGGVLSDLIMKRSGDKRLGRRAVGASGMALAGLMMLVSPWVEGVGWLAVLYGVCFIGNDLAMGPAWAAASDIGERHAGTLAGAMNMFGSLTAALAAVVAGQLFYAATLAEKSGDMASHGFYMTLPFVIFAAVYFLGALCWLRVDVTETIPQGDD